MRPTRVTLLFTLLIHVPGCSLAEGVPPDAELVNIAIDPTRLELGDSATLSATATYSDGTDETITDLAAWTSADPNVAAISTSTRAP